MIDDVELERWLADVESDRVERKESASDGKKIRQAICAFANDMPDHRKPGVIFIGVREDGTCANLPITDVLLRTLADMRSDGNILPIPTMTVEKRTLKGCEVAVILVEPSDAPPVRFDGRVWIRVGPRRAVASAEEERRLNEKRRFKDIPFDLRPMAATSLDDLDLDLFRRVYLPSAVASEVLEENQRPVEEQLAALRFVSVVDPPRPTVVGLLTVGKSPTDHVPGAYVQFLRVEGLSLEDPIADQKECRGSLSELLKGLDDLLRANIHVMTDLQTQDLEVRQPDYPLQALQQLIRNAVMHRNYETSNAPVRLTWFRDRVEIQNPGGPYGQVTRGNFGRPGITDYRNPHMAEAMRNLGFVQRFGVGISLAKNALKNNGNPPPEFVADDHYVLVTVRAKS